jgi:hypothetical protein
VPHAKGGDQRVDRSHLDSGPSTPIAEVGRLHVIGSRGHQRGQTTEVMQDFVPVLWAQESLQQLLQNDSRDDNELPSRQSPREAVGVEMAKFD